MTNLQTNRLDEPVEIHDYNPACIEVFRTEALRLQSQLKDYEPAVEHIGSTAVPGLRGKPVVDIMVGVASRYLYEEVLRLPLSDYESLGEAGVRGRLYFRKRKTEAINVHAVEYNGKHWIDNLLLRDYLCCHLQAAERYGRSKDQIVERGVRTLLAYSEAKREIIENLLGQARAWRVRQSPQSGAGA